MACTSAPTHDAVAGRRLTPMLRQYVDAKAACPDAILMFRMGDFFELFFEDAKIAARELDLTLTAREKNDDPIPMAGVPHHAVAGYIAKLVDRGYTVALCDQVEDPKKAKGLVKREITRLITPGTVADMDALDPGAANYLACVDRQGELYTVALLDLLAGELLCTEVQADTLGDELRRMGVREVLVTEAWRAAVMGAVADERVAVRTWTLPPLDDKAARKLLDRRFGLDLIEGLPQGGGVVARRALCQLIEYAESTQRRPLPHLMPPRAYRIADYLVLDETTRRNLELCATQMENRRRGSLLWHLDRCQTAVGSRALHHWLLFPLRERAAIEARLDAVQAFKSQRAFREAVQSALDGVRDVERLVGRVAVGRATPKDVGALLQSLQQVPALREQLGKQASKLGERWLQLDTVADLREALAKALVDDAPMVANEGGIFRRGFCPELDELITLSTEGHGYLADLEKRERLRSGISKLKVRYNKVFGYYLEVTNANLGQVPKDYVRKQTLVNAERFITAELKEFEEKVLYADERRREREQMLFEQLVGEVAQHIERLRAVSRLIADTDALASLAQVADEGRYVRPTLCDDSVLEIREGRHPVLERLLPGGERFVPNDVQLDAAERQLLIVTGPNMAGKSTVMRQTALCAIMAHMGGFVPAKAARIGLCDRLFTRVGASDNLGRGQSTFMVEMMETASILRHATAKSLVLLDEIGRGTSTFDGVSLAWAVAEQVHDATRCRAMFATHYHELTELAVSRPRIANVSVAVKEQGDSVVFLRRLVEGPANRSYGIEVARLAGVPEPVLVRARQILQGLEGGEHGAGAHGPIPTEAPRPSRRAPRAEPEADPGAQLALFAQPQPAPVELALADLDPMQMTPLEALAALARLKALVRPTEHC